ncbi:hypothetical protein [Photobacterium halotolerans]|uniref:hypothetical protein n=1 Tax=Photobacterium halotolerans TaxID=265726 RepID=UPI0004248863|nr:hypothetical protein [Photobacterium halotolerans]
MPIPGRTRKKHRTRNRKDLIRHIRNKAIGNQFDQWTMEDIEPALRTLIQYLCDRLANGDALNVGPFGYLYVQQYRAGGHLIVRREQFMIRHKRSKRRTIKNAPPLNYQDYIKDLIAGGMPLTLASLVVIGFLEMIWVSYISGERFEVRGLGTFDGVANPNKAWGDIPHFKVALSLRDRLNREINDRVRARLPDWTPTPRQMDELGE